MNPKLRLILFALLGLASSPSALPQTARSGGGASAQAMQQLQQLAAERATLQEENTRLKGERDSLKKERDALKGGQQGLERRARSAEVSIARAADSDRAASAALEAQKTKMQELVEKFRATVETLRGIERERDELKVNGTKTTADLTTCVAHNVALYDLNLEILHRLDGRGVFTRIAEVEPFTQLKRVQLENLIDGYRNRAEDHLVAPPVAAPPVAAPPKP
jgi:DNA repair exonuclease SbcCD ATPase subunit